jgi:hypothetical protein
MRILVVLEKVRDILRPACNHHAGPRCTFIHHLFATPRRVRFVSSLRVLGPIDPN